MPGTKSSHLSATHQSPRSSASPEAGWPAIGGSCAQASRQPVCIKIENAMKGTNFSLANIWLEHIFLSNGWNGTFCSFQSTMHLELV